MKEMHPLRWTFTVVYLLCVYGVFQRPACEQDEWTPLAVVVFMVVAVISAIYDFGVVWWVKAQSVDQRRLRVINGAVLLVATGTVVAFYALRKPVQCGEETRYDVLSDSRSVAIAASGNASTE